MTQLDQSQHPQTVPLKSENSSLLKRAIFATWVLGILAWPLQSEASINKNNIPTTSLKQSNSDLGNFFWKYAPNIKKSFFELQALERQDRKNGAGMAGRTIKWESPNNNPDNPLELFFNDAELLKEKTLWKKLEDVAGITQLNNDNAEDVVMKIFTAGEEDRSWLRQLINGQNIPFGDKEFEKYAKEIDNVRTVLFFRMQNPRFRAFAIEQFNALVPVLSDEKMIGKKTLQIIFTGAMGMADEAENAAHFKKTGRTLSKDPMTSFDHASQIGRLVSLIHPKQLILRVHISRINSPESLVWFVGQLNFSIQVMGNIKQHYGVEAKDIIDVMNSSMEQGIRAIKESKWSKPPVLKTREVKNK